MHKTAVSVNNRNQLCSAVQFFNSTAPVSMVTLIKQVLRKQNEAVRDFVQQGKCV